MEIDTKKEGEHFQLENKPVDDVLSCSSSILNTDNDGVEGNVVFEDGINVTLLWTPPAVIIPVKSDEQTKSQFADNKGTIRNKLSEAGQKRFNKLVDSGYSRI